MPQICCSGMPTVIVGDGPKRAPDARAIEEDRERHDERARDPGGEEVELRHVDAGRIRDPLDRLVLDADVQAAHVCAPQDLRHAFEYERKADGCHEQRDLRLIDERSKHDALRREPDEDHHTEGGREGEPEVEAVLLQPDERQRREEYERTLREIEDARSLVDQHEAERD